ncbi:DUF421 domain-containing protein [Halomonas sabkhae]|uniref:DUF421 domain-containing protein n=1 Tax=Halomonas sabkhae TaxID=626223 RepID=UPI0025B35D3E|nr:YetF domain-containing protein [Halomonas sabkhae]MDN3525548.1 DUF421 domain-containing protein [Halomonas sabkhae]
MTSALPTAVIDMLQTMGTALAMYLLILVLAKLCGVRSFAQLSSFDIAATIAIGSIMASTVVTGPSALLPGLVGLTTLYGLQVVVSGWRRRQDAVRRTIDSPPILLMQAGGEILWDNMDCARVTEDDLRTAMRAANVIDPQSVQAIIMEGTGGLRVLHGHGTPIPRDAWILQGVRH